MGTILNDAALLMFAEYHITNFDPATVNPASLDLRLSGLWVDLHDPKKQVFQAKSVVLYPNDFGTYVYNALPHRQRRTTLLLASTLESVDIPASMYAMVKMKTTPCREGLGHPIADWVDPGFCGNITLMLHAFKPIRLTEGQRICQLVIGELDAPSLRPYSKTGHYQNQSGPTISWRQRDDYQ